MGNCDYIINAWITREDFSPNSLNRIFNGRSDTLNCSSDSQEVLGSGASSLISISIEAIALERRLSHRYSRGQRQRIEFWRRRKCHTIFAHPRTSLDHASRRSNLVAIANDWITRLDLK